MRNNRTYKIIVAAVFTVLICIESFYTIFIVADYYANPQPFVAACINKNNKQMHCNGQCQLQKKITDAGNKDKQHSERKNDEGRTVFSSHNFLANLILAVPSSLKQEYIIHNQGMPVDNAYGVFHPPQDCM